MSYPLLSLALGAAVSSLRAVLSVIESKNSVIVTYSGGEVEAVDAVSVAAIGLRQLHLNLSGTITDSATATKRAEAELAARMPAAVTATVSVNASHDIAALLPGVMLRLNNTNLADTLGPMRVSQVTYDGATAELECGRVIDNLGDELSALVSK